MRKLTCDPTTQASRPAGDDGDSAFKSSHLSEDYDAFSSFEGVSDALATFPSRSVQLSAPTWAKNARSADLPPLLQP
jgi:hypothetical protein